MKLLELLAVVGIIGILASMLLTSIHKPDKLMGVRANNVWRNYKIELIMDDSLPQQALEQLLSH